MLPRALICGISGQDGAYLARLLLSKGYQVWGTSRNSEASKFEGLKVLNIIDQIKKITMNPEDFQSVINVISEIKPNEIYNLAGQSSVGLSFQMPLETMSGIANGTLNQLEAIRIVDKSIRYYCAGSSECFGDTGGLPASEETVFRPQSPYAVAKAAATWHVKVYQQSYDLFTCTGILFNHESPLRSENFVTKKIVTAIERINSGSDEKLRLGNIDIRRDWGWAPEYVESMWLMLQQRAPESLVIATGVSQSLREFVEAAFAEVGLDWQDHVIVDPTLKRPTEPIEIVGNPEKAKKILGWKSKINGIQVAKKMLENK